MNGFLNAQNPENLKLLVRQILQQNLDFVTFLGAGKALIQSDNQLVGLL